MDVDVDNDFDGKFLDQFRSMGTTDRDVLIAEFQAVLGNNINPESCAFFLDMNNWNLQNAVCSYYDFEQPASSLPSMAIVADVTIGAGESVAPNTSFTKTWKINNSGVQAWPPGCHFRFCSGDNLASFERRMVNVLSPGETAEICLEMRSPATSGTYVSLWRMSTPTGIFFGDVVNVNVIVAEGGLLGLTQQLSRIGGSQNISSNHALPAESANPFLASEFNPSVEPCPEQLLQPFPSNQIIAQDPTNAKLLHSSVSLGEEDTDMS